MPAPRKTVATLPKVRSLPTAERAMLAVEQVLDHDLSMAKATVMYGVAMGTLRRYRDQEKTRRARLAQDMAALAREQAAAEAGEAERRELFEQIGTDVDLIGPLGLNERRRIPTGAAFHQQYFSGNLNFCPTCRVRHDMPDFHREILEKVHDPDIKRLLITVPPYHAKTTLVTIRDTVERICVDPNYTRIIVSRSLDFARTILHSISEMLTNREVYEGSPRNAIDDWGPFRDATGNSVWNSQSIYVAGRTSAEKDPTVTVLGIGNQIYGRRAMDIVFDDVATVSNSSNPEQVAKQLEWTQKEALTRIGDFGKAMWVGTRVTGFDMYGHLQKLSGYEVLRYPVILDEVEERTLWPEHFTYANALTRRDEMGVKDFALVYMNHEMPGVGASFTTDNVEPCLDEGRNVGQFDPHWRIVAGLDLAGGGPGGGVTSAMVIGVDLRSGRRYIIENVAVQGMKAPELKEMMLGLSEQYPIFEWRVEKNATQSQIVQYNLEITRPLAQRGIRITPHVTGANKWDPQFGVESLAPQFTAELWSIPWGSAPSRARMQPLLEELYTFPIGAKSDRVMSLWFAELAARDLMQRANLPLFDSQTERWPNRVKRNRFTVDFNDRQIRRVPLSDQTASRMIGARRVLGRPAGHDAPPAAPPAAVRFVNLGEPHAEPR